VEERRSLQINGWGDKSVSDFRGEHRIAGKRLCSGGSLGCSGGGVSMHQYFTATKGRIVNAARVAKERKVENKNFGGSGQ